MSAQVEFSLDFIAEGTTVSLFIHGYDSFEFVTYCIRTRDITWFPGLPRVPHAVASFSLGDTSIHVDLTVARTVFVTNESGFTAVDLYALREPIQ
jgi:hypothetical protein